jgi:4'-phosphopantetheinyl transferase
MTIRQPLIPPLPVAVPSKVSVSIVTTELVAPDEQLDEIYGYLSADERSRQQRFLTADTRRRFGICRARLRLALAGLLDISPGDVKFEYNAHGKPQLSACHRSTLQFNVSHSADWGVFAFTRSTPVGVDIEIPRSSTVFLSLESQVLNEAESAAIKHLTPNEREHQIKLAWVAKEALMKAIGIGIGFGMRHVSLKLPLQNAAQPYHIDSVLMEPIDDDGSCRSNWWTDASAWRIHQLQLHPQASAAVACANRISDIVLHNL